MTSHPAERTGDSERVARLAAFDDALASRFVPSQLDGPDADEVAVLRLLDQLRTGQPSPAAMDATTGVGARYDLRGLRAVGGVGQVWRAFDNELGREVALKVLRPDRAGDPALAARFLHEARITGQLQHPGVVPVYELGTGTDTDDEPPFYAMRLVQGRTLTTAIAEYHDHCRSGTASPVDRATLLNAFVSVCNTVAYAHATRVVHRDLKPANVALGDYGEVVVLDWGFAKVLGSFEPPLGTSAPADPLATATGQVLGTPAYMAPEQALGQVDRLDERTDVFGLGAILYEILTGRPPFPGDDSAEVLELARTGHPQRPSSVTGAVPPALEAVCLKALALEPGDRYPTAGSLARDVQHWLADEPVTAYAEPVPARIRRWGRRHPAWTAGTAALLITGLSVAALAQVLIRHEQAAAADERVRVAIEHANAIMHAQADQRRQLYLHRIALAERTLAAHNPSRTLTLLDECPRDLREWEWHCLNRLCRSEAIVLKGHTETVQAAAFSPDGRVLATAGFDRTICLWDGITGRRREELRGHAGVVYDLAFSPDGRHLASASWDGTARVWDLTSAQAVIVCEGHVGNVENVVYSPDGRTLYTRASDGVIRAWNATTGEPLKTFQSGWAAVSLAVHPNGHVLAVGGPSGEVRVVDAVTGVEVGRLAGHQNPVRALAFSGNGQMLASGDGDLGRSDAGEIKIWDWASEVLLRRFYGHTDPVMRVAFAAGDRRLASASHDRTIKIWDLISGQEVLTLHAHTDTVRCVTFSPDGLRLASAGADKSARIWDATPWTGDTPVHERRSFVGHRGRALGVAFHPHNQQVASIGDDREIFMWDPDRQNPVRSVNLAEFGEMNFPGAEMDYFSVVFSADGQKLATANSGGTVAILDARGRVQSTMLGHGMGPIRGLAFRPGTEQLASASWDRTIRVWNLASGQVSHVLAGHIEPVNGVAYDPTGRWLASASNDQTVRLWNAETGRLVQVLPGHTSSVFGVAFNPEGTLLASAGNDHTIRLWDTATWREQRILNGHLSGVRAVVFSPDGRRLASAGHDWTVRLWQIPDGEPVGVLRGHTDRVHGLAFSRDGRLVASASYDGTVKLWDVTAAD